MVQVKDDISNTSLIQGSKAIILANTTKKDLARLHHTALGSPAKSTLLTTIDKDFLASFSGLTRKLVKKHLPKMRQQ